MLAVVWCGVGGNYGGWGLFVCVLQVNGCRCYWYLPRCCGCGPMELVCSHVHCLSVSFQLVWFLGWGWEGSMAERSRGFGSPRHCSVQYYVHSLHKEGKLIPEQC